MAGKGNEDVESRHMQNLIELKKNMTVGIDEKCLKNISLNSTWFEYALFIEVITTIRLVAYKVNKTKSLRKPQSGSSHVNRYNSLLLPSQHRNKHPLTRNKTKSLRKPQSGSSHVNRYNSLLLPSQHRNKHPLTVGRLFKDEATEEKGLVENLGEGIENGTRDQHFDSVLQDVKWLETFTTMWIFVKGVITVEDSKNGQNLNLV
nr:hypothetical protein [Tanacetum cinerariifolium]